MHDYVTFFNSTTHTGQGFQVLLIKFTYGLMWKMSPKQCTYQNDMSLPKQLLPVQLMR